MLLGFACDELACKPGSTAAPAIMVNSRRVMFMGGLESAGILGAIRFPRLSSIG
jgi:hypothetical protein